MSNKLGEIERKENVIIKDEKSYLNTTATIINALEETNDAYIQAIKTITESPNNQGPFVEALQSFLSSYESSTKGIMKPWAEGLAIKINGIDEAIKTIDENSIKTK